MYFAYDDINSKYLATYAKTIDTNPLIKNLQPIMTKPAPSSLRLRVLPTQIHVIPNAIIIVPAARRGLNSILELVEDFIQNFRFGIVLNNNYINIITIAEMAKIIIIIIKLHKPTKCKAFFCMNPETSITVTILTTDQMG
jgi:hypothetical protein